MATYTLDNLVADCVGRVVRGGSPSHAPPHGRVEPLLANHLLGAKTYRAAWDALVEWTAQKLAGDTEYSVVLPRLGVIYYRVFNLGIRIPQFELAPKFEMQYGLKRSSPPSPHLASATTMRPDFSRLARLAGSGMDTKVVATALATLMECLGEVMASGRDVVIDMSPVGQLACSERLVTFHFSQHLDSLRGSTTSSQHSPSKGKKAEPRGAARAYARINANRDVAADRGGLSMRGTLDLSSIQATGNGHSSGVVRSGPGSSRHRHRGVDILVSPIVTPGALPAVTAPRSPPQAHQQQLPSVAGATPRFPPSLGESLVLARTARSLSPGPASPDAAGSLSARLATGAPPPLIDAYARTRAAPFSGSAGHRPLVDRIGALYTPSASQLTMIGRKGVVTLRRKQAGRGRAAANGPPTLALTLGGRARGGGGGGGGGGAGRGGRSSPRRHRFGGTVPVSGSAAEETLSSPFRQGGSAIRPTPPARSSAARRSGGRRDASRLRPAVGPGGVPALDLTGGVANGGADGDLDAMVEAELAPYWPIAMPQSPWLSPAVASGSTSFFSDPIQQARLLAVPTPAREAYCLSPRAAAMHTPVRRLVREELSASPEAWRHSVALYRHYQRHGVDPSVLPAMNTAWIEAVMRLLPAPPARAPTAYDLTALLTGMLVEVRGSYEDAARRAILDYVLRSPEERQRIGISVLPPNLLPLDWGWGAGVVVPTPPPAWHASVAKARAFLERHLHITSPAMRALSWLWRDYSHLSLVEVPQSDVAAMVSGWRPQHVKVFEAAQSQRREATYGLLMGEWYERCMATVAAATLTQAGLEACGLVEAAAKASELMYGAATGGAIAATHGHGGGSGGDAPVAPQGGHQRYPRPSVDMLPSYYAAVSVVMAKRLRSVVQASLDQLVTFFRRYRRRQQRLQLRDLVLQSRRRNTNPSSPPAGDDGASAGSSDGKDSADGGKAKEPVVASAPPRRAAPANGGATGGSATHGRKLGASLRGGRSYYRFGASATSQVFTPDAMADAPAGDGEAIGGGAPFSHASTAGHRPAFVLQLVVNKHRAAAAAVNRSRHDAALLGDDSKGVEGGDGSDDSDGDDDAAASSAIAFSPSPEEVEERVRRTFDACVNAFANTQRVETRLHGGSMRGPRYLPAVDHKELCVQEPYAEVTSILRSNLRDVHAVLELYRPYEFLLDETDRLEALLAHDPTLEECQGAIDRYRAAAGGVAAHLPATLPTDLCLLDCQRMNQELVDRAEELVARLLNYVAHRYMSYNAMLVKQFKAITAQLAQRPQTSKQLVDAEEYIDHVRDKELDLLSAAVDKGRAMLAFLFDNHHKVTADLVRPLENTTGLLGMMEPAVLAGERTLMEERTRLEAEFSKARDEFQQQLDALAEQVEGFKTRGDSSALWQNADEVNAIGAALDVAAERAQEMNVQEQLLGWTSTNFVRVDEIRTALEPFKKLWGLVVTHHRSSHEWVKKCVFNLDAAKVDADVHDMYRTAAKLTRQLAEDAPAAASVAEATKEKLESFKKHLPLLHVVCNPSMQKRHWTQVSDIVGFTIRPDQGTDLIKLVDIGINDYIQELEVISTAATQEGTIEKGLQRIADEWTPAEFEFKDYKDTGTSVLVGASVDMVQELLDDHTIKVQGMRGSAYAKPFQRTIADLEHFLESTQEIVDMWLKVQSHWLYLQPIMTAPDIARQLPAEGKSFAAVDNTWRNVMRQAAAAPACTQVVRIDRLLEQLTKAYTSLEQTMHSLNAYLETKRAHFSRFFFLSNDELLEILAEARRPEAVQPHLRKCFEGINRLEFQQPSGDITAMVSAEGERVELVTVVNPSNTERAVEKWLLQVEDSMRATMKSIIEAALADYPTRPRVEWVTSWPGQVVLAGNGTYWTQEVEAAMKSGGADGVAQYARQLDGQIQDIVHLVRGKLEKSTRKTLSAVVVLDVHARDVTKQLAELRVSEPTEFEWISQMRNYWQDDTMFVRMISSSLEYAYEYVGNSGRLVITPLTDRCYRTLIGAVALQYGGAPEGPAGTGKTETVKDLAKALARQCVVFNCSDQLDYKAMAKFFKGLASSGAWACFDEFNRIELEVLSVVAQQITTIQQAIAKQLTSFTFEGTNIRLRWTANVFITMNPGYAGRSELPDNLKVLFRTVAMMVPDYAMIAEIILYSSGYLDAKALARKIVATYKLCSEQLSNQSHYDYGMRAVMAVLRRAGNLKLAHPTEPEAKLMLRAINDVNVPKFLDYDLPLFRGIVSDLFPGVGAPAPPSAQLQTAVLDAIAAKGLQPLPYFVEKVIQTYETMVVRHGFMVVGETLSGKTAILEVLQAALALLHERRQLPNNLNTEHELQVDMQVINPKSIPLSRLYGCFDPVSHEWTNGILAVLFKRAATDSANPNRKWLVFDGPVDAVWIENINTVLDDNKKLCLMSGEIIAMSDTMSMLFEPADLAVASPATVSRCGMVFTEPHKLGWRVLVESYLQQLPAHLQAMAGIVIGGLAEWVFFHAAEFARREMSLLAPVSAQMMAASLLRLVDALIAGVKDDAALAKSLGDRGLTAWLEGAFLFALVWTVGGAADEASRAKFNAWLRKALLGNLAPDIPRRSFVAAPPAQGSLFGYVFEPPTSSTSVGTWLAWTTRYEAQPPAPTTGSLSSIIVPTVDTERYTYLLDLAVQHRHHTAFVGATGTGKTAYILAHLAQLDKARFQTLLLSFSSQTTETGTQKVLESGLTKRRKNVLGPEPGRFMLAHVDDLNLPAVEEYGAQPPLELLRQCINCGGWYGPAPDMAFTRVIDVAFIGSLQPPGGGRNPVPSRLLRHMHVVGMLQGSDAVLTRIFKVQMKWQFQARGFSQAAVGLIDKLVKGTLRIYKASVAGLLPTPARSHYTFNLRDFSRVVRGMMLAEPATIKDDTDKLLRLWVHESLRVFSDRLINDEDREWFCQQLRTTMTSVFSKNFNVIFSHLDLDGDGSIDSHTEIRGLVFGDFMHPGAVPRMYDEVQVFGDIKVGKPADSIVIQESEHKNHEGKAAEETPLQKVMKGYLEEYNLSTTKPMDLVMFMFAVEHLSRISRVLRMPGAHALLVGVGGSGRRSLTRLAAFMSECALLTIEVTKQYGMSDWHDDLKRVLTSAGADGQDTVFLFSDNQIKLEAFVEDINSILNTGHVPNLFEADELTTIMEKLRPALKAAKLTLTTPAEHYEFFKQRVREKLHVVLCFSPIGGGFRSRVRSFPSLVNCCTIDWFSEWPEDALIAVARRFLADVDMEEELLEPAVVMCMHFHQSVQQLSVRFMSELRRHYYVTPTSYLELITTFKGLLAVKREEVKAALRRYQVGLEKLADTEASVARMQVSLTEMQPILERSTQETLDMMNIVDTQTAEAQGIRQVVAGEEAVANEKAAEARAIKEDCERDLAKALPALKAAMHALKVLKKSDVVEVKSMKSPPEGVVLVMEAVCIMMGVKPEKKKVDGVTKVDYWDAAKRNLLNDMRFLQNLIEYDKDNISEKKVSKATPLLQDPRLEPEVIKKASTAAYGLSCWVRAMVEYYHVNKVVVPKKIKLKASQAEYEEVMTGLRGKQAELAKVEKHLDDLGRKLRACERKKSDLEQEIENVATKLSRAKTLITQLGGEAIRWKASAERLTSALAAVTGDVLLSSAVVAYLGAFTSSFRSDITASWAAFAAENGIQCTSPFSVVDTLGNAVTIRNWQIAGLPVDAYSSASGVIVSNARRWPLMIDPQGQANRWIRNMEKHNDLLVLKPSDADLMRRLEVAVRYGRPALLENVGEELDPALEPLLLRQVFKKGGIMSIQLGDSTVEYNSKFRLYMTTKMSNPHYLPNVAVKVTLLNFVITPDGLNDQLLGWVVRTEQPELEAERARLVVQGAANKKALRDIEDEILGIMSNSKGSILDDGTAIEALTRSKALSREIEEKQRIAEVTEKKIEETRASYKPVADEASVLFFCTADMGSIDPMYQYSLEWFVNIFLSSMRDAAPADDVVARVRNISEYFTLSLFRNVSRSLFSRHKLLFCVLIAVKLLQARDPTAVSASEWRFLLTGGVSTEDPPANPAAAWLSATGWEEIVKLSSCSTALEGLPASFEGAGGDAWQAWRDSELPHKAALPAPWQSQLNSFTRICLIRALRPDKVVEALKDYVAEQLSDDFREPPPFDIASSYRDSSATAPLVFVLSPGSDPTNTLTVFAERQGVQLRSLSLGQGQDTAAETLMQRAQREGSWLVLQNCHLYPSWMPTLEAKVEAAANDPEVHPSYRLWLTSYPSPAFPISILQNGVKMTNEPPTGVRGNMLASFKGDPLSSPEFFEGCANAREFKKLLFSLAFFHAAVQERRQYGALGWNIQYQFSDSDLRISAQQLHHFLDMDGAEVPFKTLMYLVGQCNYGGRVTDARDRRCLMSMLATCFDPRAVTDGYALSESGLYQAPASDADYATTLAHVQALPASTTPEVFGLHENATITKDVKEAMSLFEELVLTQPRSGGGGGAGDAESTVDEVAAGLLAKLPDDFDIEAAQQKYPVDYTESMNTVLVQELQRYNRLLSTVRQSLTDIRAAIRGLIVMNDELEAGFGSLFNNQVPQAWDVVSYPSVRPLASYMADLVLRLQYFAEWNNHGPPAVFWLPGLFFTQSFLTGSLQNYARKNTIPIDTLGFRFEVLAEDDPRAAGSSVTKPADGVLVKGMYLEGARWDYDTMMLGESAPAVLFTPAPTMWMLPCIEDEAEHPPHYDCPLYKTPARWGTLSTTGHSTNFVMTVKLPSGRDADHWVKRGVALLLQLST